MKMLRVLARHLRDGDVIVWNYGRLPVTYSDPIDYVEWDASRDGIPDIKVVWEQQTQWFVPNQEVTIIDRKGE